MSETNRYLTIADDFTGANDTGVQICRRGMPVSVVLSASGVEADGSYVIDTESRALPPEAAHKAVSEQLAGVDFSAFRHVLKKVDSTLRGSIGAEVAATEAAMKPELVVFAPALPDLGRTTEGAIHKLNGVPITQTEMAKDPKTPVQQDNIQAILQAVFSEPVQHISIEALEAGAFSFAEARIFSVDATTNEHLTILVRTALDTGKRILWVGTAALADTLLGQECTVRPALAVVASLSQVSSEQLAWAQKQGAKLVSVSIADLLLQKDTPERIAQEAVALLQLGKDVLVASAASVDRKTGFASADAAAVQSGMEPNQVSGYTQEKMGQIARLILDAYRPSGVFLTGGDTAIAFLCALEATGSSIESEMTIGIPIMRLRGGPFSGLKVITKAGAFGAQDAISYALRKLKEMD